jgi:Tfp pilus assembly protein PilO
MPSATLDLATSKSVADEAATLAEPVAETQEPIASSSAVPLVLGEVRSLSWLYLSLLLLTDIALIVCQGCDLSSLLTFDPESIEPATKASEEPGPSATHSQLQQLRALLSSSIETLVENPEEVKSLLEEIQPHLPVTLQVKLWPVVTLSAYKSRVELARQRISLRHAQLPLKADIANKCRRLNEKKAALDTKTDTSASTAELEALRKELEVLEERVRVTKQLIQDKEALIAHSREEAEGLQAELKTELAGIRALNKQLVTGQDEDDEAEIAEVDRVRVTALHALDAFLQ